MEQGHVDHITRYAAQGWAIDTDSVDAHSEVAVYVNDVFFCRGLANIARSDLTPAERFGHGHHGFRLRYPRSLDPNRSQTVEIRFARSNTLIPNGGRHFEAIDRRSIEATLARVAIPALTPLLVTHIARSGSTLLMKYLSHHSAIVVAERYPYEVKPATYYSCAARLLTAPADHEHSASPTEFTRDPNRLGFNPFNHFSFDSVFRDLQLQTHFFDVSLPNRLASTLAGCAEDYYRHLAADQDKREAVFFSEKCEAQGNTRSSVLWMFPQAREVVLVRDPRDILCSSKAYFKLANYQQFIENIGNACQALLAIAAEARNNTVFITYESLLGSPAEALSKLAATLSISPSDWTNARIAGDEKLFALHATANSPSESIGRWRQDLDHNVQQECLQRFRKFLEYFGYQ